MAVSTYPPLRSSTIHHKFRSIKTHAIRNVSSARVSVPSIVVQNPSPQPGEFPWKWRTSLHATAPYWTSAYCDICLFRLVFAQLCVSGWFTGLSGKFLSARTARLLALAGAERLDKELMIGQMQGKFQLVVLGGVGHIVHEVNTAPLLTSVAELTPFSGRSRTSGRRPR